MAEEPPRRVMPRSMSLALLLGSVVSVVGMRWPFRSEGLLNWDSANFALAVERIDIAAHRPHPPGYLGYVFAGRALTWLTGDVNAALVAWNIIATVLALVVVTRFAWDIGDERDRIWAAVGTWAILVTSPLVWFHGEVAEIYVSEMLVSLLIAYAAWRAIAGRARALEACAGALVLAVLFKVTVAVFLLPLAGFAAVRASTRERLRAAALLAVGLAATTWLFFVVEPDIARVTWSQFTQATSGSRLLDGSGSGLRSFNRNLRDTLTAGLEGVGVINALALIAWALVDRRLMRNLDWRVPVLWVGPWLSFLLLVHIGRPGYVLPLLPVAALVLGGFYGRQRRPVAALLIALQALANVAHFTALVPFSDAATGGALAYRQKTLLQRLASDAQPITFATASTITTSDARLARLRRVAVELCPAGPMVVVAGSEPVDWRRVMWYLPEATAVYVEGKTAVYVAHHKDFSPVPAAGLALPSTCPALWLAPKRGLGGANPSGLPATPVPGLGWSTPAGLALRVLPSGVSTAHPD